MDRSLLAVFSNRGIVDFHHVALGNLMGLHQSSKPSGLAIPFLLKPQFVFYSRGSCKKFSVRNLGASSNNKLVYRQWTIPEPRARHPQNLGPS